MTGKALLDQILYLVQKYTILTKGSEDDSQVITPDWKPGDHIPYSAKVYGYDEVAVAVESSLDFWLTLGAQGELFEKDLCSFLGIKDAILVNSGSSANLVALSTLTSSSISSSRRILRGDEVVTVAAGFPTTVSPIVQVGAVPVFVDACANTGNIIVDRLQEAYVPGKTKAVMLAHTLGNPFDIAGVLSFCKKNRLWLIEDNCDALGSIYSMPEALASEFGFVDNSPGLTKVSGYVTRWTGTWGDLSTQSFYPPHHITMGEGGSVNIVGDKCLAKISRSFRDWGRDCWCSSGQDNKCGKRFGWQLGTLPAGYDHKYTYSHLGYNLKPLDIQAAIGRVQLRRLEQFTKARRHNWEMLYEGLKSYDNYIRLSLPTHARARLDSSKYIWDDTGCMTIPSWFGFKIDLTSACPFSKRDLSAYLDLKNIGHRSLFGGNLIRQPCFQDLLQSDPNAFRIIGQMNGADSILENSIFIGTYPGLSTDMIDYVLKSITDFLDQSIARKSL